jgi:RimJ/RimL family protein N-acetyltransferase
VNAPLLTERLILREFVEADFDALREIAADPEVLRYRSRQSIPPEATREFMRYAMAQAAEARPQQYARAIMLRNERRVIGEIGLTITNPEYDEAFMWYSMNRAFWGQGYATEAADRLLRFGFEEAGLRRIFAECYLENAASARVLEKIGLLPEPVTDGGRLRFGLSRRPTA